MNLHIFAWVISSLNVAVPREIPSMGEGASRQTVEFSDRAGRAPLE
jgi:hypothetical protein